MARISRGIIITALLASILTSRVQGNHFTSKGLDGYITSIEEIFSTTPNTRATRDFLNQLRTFWLNPSTPADLKQSVMEVSDLIHLKRGRPFPDYHLYLSSIMSLVASNHPPGSINAWHAGTKEMLAREPFTLRQATNMFALTISIIETDVIFTTPSVTWYAPGAPVIFSFNETIRANVQNTTLVCRVRDDSIKIHDTSGSLDLLSGKFTGERGRVTWELSGFDPGMVHATFNEFTIDMTRHELMVENVQFRNRQYFAKELHGRLFHRVMNHREPEHTTFPRFNSHGYRYRIDNIFKGFNFEGGFAQHGAKAIGSGTASNPAQIIIYREGKPFITARSLNFALRTDQIVSNTCELTIHLDTGYIFHPGLLFRYYNPGNEILMIREGNGISNSPFFNTFHNVTMDVEMIRWDMATSEMELRRLKGASINQAFFESISFFTGAFFNRLQGMDAVHPLQALSNFSRHLNHDRFTAADYARFMRKPENQVRQQVIGLSFHGFVAYDVNNDSITIKPRLTDFLLFRAGKKDHDVMRFNSHTEGHVPSAILDLNNFDLVLNGVPSVYISDRQNVRFYPANERVILKENRGMIFDGSIKAGLIDLHGHSFSFDYENFKVNLNVVDSITLSISTNEEALFGQRQVHRVGNTVRQLSGSLQIDRPNNKSGILEHPGYPVLTSNDNAYVFFDHPLIQRGAYDRESFYFYLDPFEIDSLNVLTRSNIAFKGMFHSSILPDLRETLVVQPDLSLGFNRQTPAGGYQVYNGRAMFTNEINLSNQGLVGNGTLSYLTATAISDDFTFLPQNVYGKAATFNIAPRENAVSFPDVQGDNVSIEFYPDQENMVITTLETPFTLYNRETTLSGSVKLTPGGLKGNGQLNLQNAFILANNFNLGHHVVVADSSDFHLTGSPGQEEIRFGTNNLTSRVDFKTRLGVFTTRDAANKVEFTENRFIAYIKGFSWNIDKNDIFLGTSGGPGNRFVSAHRQQDSLEIIIPLALYDVEAGQILAEEVESIQVADARIILRDGKVTINRNAVLDTLENAQIVLNNSVHQFRGATVSILGKYEFNATGKYDFINGARNTKTITFNNISVGRDRLTRAEGQISEQELFTFDPNFAFKGNVSLVANNALLNFDGGVQMLHACSVLGPQNYLRFQSAINPFDVRIPLEENPRNFDFENIYNSFFLNRDSSIIYSSFLESRKFHTDVPLISARGYLFFNNALNSFVITDPPGLNSTDTTSNILMYHNNGCTVTGEGIINFGLELGQVKTFAAGEISHTRQTGQTNLLTITGLDFMLDNASVDLMVNSLRVAQSNARGNPGAPSTISRLAKWMGTKTARLVAEELNTYEKTRRLPVEHQHMLVIDSLSWRWDPGERAYLANTRATLLWVRDNPVNILVNVKAAITFSRGGNSLELYLGAPGDLYFFFAYRNGIMQTRSSNQEFNTNVQTLETGQRVAKRQEGERGYSFIMAPESRVLQLLERFEETEEPETELYPLEVPLEVDDASEPVVPENEPN